MSEQKKFKVGDKVHVIGHPNIEGRGEVLGVEGEWYVIGSSLIPMARVHIRNLDPVLKDERRGAPRPPIQDKEIVEITVPVMVHYSACDDLRIWQEDVFAAFRGMAGNPSMPVTDPRVRQIERRKQDLGREARKS